MNRGTGKRATRPLGITSAAILLAIQRGTSYGFDIIERTGLPSGTVYPTLGRLMRAGYLAAEWEDRQIADRERRPRRRYYDLTPEGEAALQRALQRVALVSVLADAEDAR
ncbi:MAG: PadR family transcriptional regulator [Acidobacteriota bacterium]